MILKRPDSGFTDGYYTLAEEGGLNSDMLMDFGLLRLAQGQAYECSREKERAYLLMNGKVRLSWDGAAGSGSETCERWNLLDEQPFALHVPSAYTVRIEALSDDVEIAVQRVTNPRQFEARLWAPGMFRSEVFGEGTLQGTSTRTVRTIFDAADVPESAMVLGEVVNHPGKWSSYPPHDHAHPEIYHFRFFPPQGFGLSIQGEEVFIVRDGDTAMIPGGVVHPQASAPGYAMYYIWLIPHLPGDRFGPDSRIFREEHTWVMNAEAPIWPDERLETVLKHQEDIKS